MYLKNIDNIVEHCRKRSDVSTVRKWTATNGRVHLTIVGDEIPTTVCNLVNDGNARFTEISPTGELRIELEIIE